MPKDTDIMDSPFSTVPDPDENQGPPSKKKSHTHGHKRMGDGGHPFHDIDVTTPGPMENQGKVRLPKIRRPKVPRGPDATERDS